MGGGLAVNVDELDELTDDNLRTALQKRQDQGGEITEVVPHRQGRTVGASVISHTGGSHASLAWEVERADGYGDDLQQCLQRLTDTGWTIFAVIPHRIGPNNFPEVVAYRPKADT